MSATLCRCLTVDQTLMLADCVRSAIQGWLLTCPRSRQTAMRLQGQFTTQWDIVMAGSVISILPMLAIYLFAQKYVIQGVANTGLK